MSEDVSKKELCALTLRIATETPVVLADRSGSSTLTATRNYITGTAIRGTLAACWLMSHPEVKAAEGNASFRELFLNDDVIFLPAYPAAGPNRASCPVPASLMRKKSSSEMADLSNGKESGAGYKAVQGFCDLVKAKKGSDITVKGIEVVKDIGMHMSRSSDNERVTGSSKDGNIFSYESVCAGQLFVAKIIMPRELAADMPAILDKELGFLCRDAKAGESERIVNIGRSHRTQYGRCCMMISHRPEALKCQIDKKAQLGKKLHLYAVTDFLPYDRNFFDCEQAMQEVVAVCEKALGYAAGSLVVAGAYASVSETDGFVGVWNTARPTDRGISAGAVIDLVKTDGSVFTPAEAEAIEAGLQYGTGRRRSEGYGRWQIWQHLQNKDIKYGGTAPVQGLKRQGEKGYSEATKRLAARIIEKKLADTIRALAQEAVAGIDGIHGNNHFFSRLENIIAGNKKVAGELTKLGSAKAKLQRYKIDRISLWEYLTEWDETEDKLRLCPYREVLGKRLEEYGKLAKEVGIDLPETTDETLRREYWLWFCRMARINEGKD